MQHIKMTTIDTVDKGFEIGRARGLIAKVCRKNPSPLLIGCLIAQLIPSHLVAQAAALRFGDAQAAEDERPIPNWVGQFTVLAGNAVLSGLTAGVTQKLQGKSFEDGFSRGFLGGMVIYGGKRVAVEQFAGAGFLGRGVTGVGASMVRNASTATPTLAHLVVPFGPVRVYWDRAADSVRMKLDLNTLVVAAYAAQRSELELDLSSSLSAGTPVFTAREFLLGEVEDTSQASGEVVENVILLSDLPWRDAAVTREIFAHERVHVLQREQFFITLTEPLSAELAREVPFLAPLFRVVDVHATGMLMELLKVPFPNYDTRPWELEAFHLMER
jgi:hypothetical protein